MKLELSDHLRWLELRRVRRGSVTRQGDRWLDYGQPIAVVPSDCLTALLTEGLLSLAEPSPDDCLSRLSLTDAGAERYAALCRAQRAQLPVPPPEFVRTTTGVWPVHHDDEPETPAGPRLSAPRLTAPGGRPDPS